MGRETSEMAVSREKGTVLWMVALRGKKKKKKRFWVGYDNLTVRDVWWGRPIS